MQRQAGVSMIEVMVAVFVLALGILGMTAMQLASLRANQSAYERSAAVLSAYSMVDRLRADLTAARAGSYNLALADTCAAPSGSSFQASQLAAWIGELQTSMGGQACGGIACTTGTTITCVVSVRWDDSRARGGSSNQIFSIEARL